MSPQYGHFYLVVLNSISVGIAMFTLMCFYFAVRENIRTFNPLLQFFSVKFVIFFAFWQSVAIKLLAHFSLLPTQSPPATHILSIILAMFLTCAEMALASFIHLWAFDYAPFVSVAGEGAAGGGVGEGAKDSLWFLDIWHDVKSVGAFCLGGCGGRGLRRGSGGGWRRWSSLRVGEAPEERRALNGEEVDGEEGRGDGGGS
ncbi:hypothetical protein HDV00_008674 [Rhizophlyctis rosea]|nr:hypothetical protein HDV00_008674 [Rhizophlyctis rosea]